VRRMRLSLRYRRSRARRGGSASREPPTWTHHLTQRANTCATLGIACVCEAEIDASLLEFRLPARGESMDM
jgi:hypothetical protein